MRRLAGPHVLGQQPLQRDPADGVTSRYSNNISSIKFDSRPPFLLHWRF
jgi:hypothetical protein